MIDQSTAGESGTAARCRGSQSAAALLAAGAALVGELAEDEDESDELDDSFADPDESEDPDEFDESALAAEETVLELLARESVA